METNETKLNNVRISTCLKLSGKSMVRVTIPDSPPFAGKPHFVMDHVFNTATEAGEAIHGLKEFYKYFDFDLLY